MKRTCFVACLAALLVAGTVQAQDYTLSFNGPCGNDVGQVGGGAYSASIAASVTGPAEPGIQGWSISVAGNGLAVDAISIEGTAGADVDDGGLRDGGFEKSETTSGDGNDGAVSAIVLSFTQPIVLDASAGADIAVLSVSGTFPENVGESADVGLSFVDGRQGSGQPVNNNLTVSGGTVKPAFEDCSFTLTNIEPPPVCPQVDGDGNVLSGIQAFLTPAGTVGQSEDPLAGLVEGSNAGEGPALTDVPPGSYDVYTVIASNLESGVQGWSLSLAIAADEGISVGAATTTGTAGGDVDDGGVRDGGFEKTENIDPTVNGQGDGVVSAVVCSFTQPITLEPVGSASALILPVSAETVGATLSLTWTDGLTGSGQPVNNVGTIAGGTAEYLCQQNHVITVIEQPGFFVQRGEANGDARVDLADPIYTINFLFRNGPGSSCAAAMDANGDGMVDLSDAMYSVEYLFLSGPAPAGVDGGDACVFLEDVDCEASSAACAQ